MSVRVFKLIIITLLLSGILIQAQSKREKHKRSWDKWNVDLIEWYGESRPMIELNYGTGNLEHKSFDQNRFADIGSIELKLGYSDLDFYSDDYILELDSRYIFGSKLSNTLIADNKVEGFQYKSESYRLGFGYTEGYGYRIGPVALIPYTQNAYMLSKFNKLERNEPIPVGYMELSSPQEIIDYYGDSFRFGSLGEVGVKLELASMLAVNASYEGTVIYPRVKFWKMAGSFVIEEAGYAALGEFVEKIMDRVPAAGPLMNVLLRGGYQYAIFQLRKDKMNWPFSTAEPLTYEQFKFGVTLTF
ncbi:MAG: hypothetical protein KKB34_10125 [Bacteroidetes bacterium]|nr:hypothetical protein [Bacteroidota bacterium]